MSYTSIPLHYKEWKKLPKALQEQFKKVLKRRLENPHIVSAHLGGSLQNCYKIKLRQAGYRLVYHADDKKVTVTVVAVGKRNKNEIYDASITRNSV